MNSNENEQIVESLQEVSEEILEIQPHQKKQDILIHSQIIIKPAENLADIETSEKKNEVNEDEYSESCKDKIEPTLQNTVVIANEQEVAEDNEEVSNKIHEIVKSENKASNENNHNTISFGNTLVHVDIKNTSLGFLQSQYSNSGSESDTDTSSRDSEPIVIDQDYRDQIVEVDSGSSSSDSEVELVHEEEKQRIMQFEANEEDEVDDDESNCPKKRNDPLRVKGELLFHELPPIQDLQITVPEEECIVLGKIHSIVDELVLVDSIPETVPLNLDTVLFLDKGQKVLGEIFDVLGQITSPLYCVRFNSKKQIEEKGIEIGQNVYVAPRTEHTQFVILSEIMKVRGSDASWRNDIETSPRHIDFSDDEEERNYRRGFGNKESNKTDENICDRKRSRTFSSTSQMSDSSAMTSQTGNYGQGFNYRGNNRFSRVYRQHHQFQPRNRPLYNHARLQAPPSYNYDQFNNSWHANYNFNSNYQQSNPRPNHYMNQSYYNGNYNQNFNMHEQNVVQPGTSNFNHNIAEPCPSLIYPNPYAIRSPFIPPQNSIDQPLFPPPPPPQN